MAFEDILVAPPPPPTHIDSVTSLQDITSSQNSYIDINITAPTTTVEVLHNNHDKDQLQLQEAPASPSRRSKRTIKRKVMTDVQGAHPHGSDDDDVGSGVGGGGGAGSAGKAKGTKSRRELPAGAVATLKAWLLSPEHFTHPYPTPQDQVMLMQKTGIDKKQLKNWFTNARRRIWKPMLKKQLEQGKISQTGSGGVVTMPTASPGLMTATAAGAEYVNVSVGVNPNAPGQIVDHHSQTMQQNYQQALQQQQQQQQQVQQQAHQQQQQQTYDQYGNPTTTYVQPQNQYSSNSSTNYYQQGPGQYNQQNDAMAQSASIGSLPPMPGVTTSGGSTTNMNKTDSHAVLMELFARDQDLVRQASRVQGANTGGDQSAAHQMNQDGTTTSLQNGHTTIANNNNMLGSQHPMSNKIAGGSSTVNKLGNVPSMNSWPHFSSVSSLNNLGTMTGVKSITNMSGADLVSQGSLNKKGNLAQVKSIENMGRADSYAFLEVFFDNTNSGSSQLQRGVKREREEDDNVGLSLDGDDSSPAAPSAPVEAIKSAAPVPAPLPPDGQDKEGLKRAYDDALAARGLISVSRSSEKLTDLALPAKMQRTISQEYLKSVNAGRSTTFTTFSFNSAVPQQPPASNPIVDASTTTTTVQTHLPSAPQQPHQFSAQTTTTTPTPQQQQFDGSNVTSVTSVPRSENNDSVEVPATTRCALCNETSVDTQLRPCGCMFHGRCLKPSIQNAVGAPQCPIDKTTMLSAVLAVPTDDKVCTVIRRD